MLIWSNEEAPPGEIPTSKRSEEGDQLIAAARKAIARGDYDAASVAAEAAAELGTVDAEINEAIRLSPNEAARHYLAPYADGFLLDRNSPMYSALARKQAWAFAYLLSEDLRKLEGESQGNAYKWEKFSERLQKEAGSSTERMTEWRRYLEKKSFYVDAEINDLYHGIVYAGRGIWILPLDRVGVVNRDYGWNKDKATLFGGAIYHQAGLFVSVATSKKFSCAKGTNEFGGNDGTLSCFYLLEGIPKEIQEMLAEEPKNRLVTGRWKWTGFPSKKKSVKYPTNNHSQRRADGFYGFVGDVRISDGIFGYIELEALLPNDAVFELVDKDGAVLWTAK